MIYLALAVGELTYYKPFSIRIWDKKLKDTKLKLSKLCVLS